MKKNLAKCLACSCNSNKIGKLKKNSMTAMSKDNLMKLKKKLCRESQKKSFVKLILVCDIS